MQRATKSLYHFIGGDAGRKRPEDFGDMRRAAVAYADRASVAAGKDAENRSHGGARISRTTFFERESRAAVLADGKKIGVKSRPSLPSLLYRWHRWEPKVTQVLWMCTFQVPPAIDTVGMALPKWGARNSLISPRSSSLNTHIFRYATVMVRMPSALRWFRAGELPRRHVQCPRRNKEVHGERASTAKENPLPIEQTIRCSRGRFSQTRAQNFEKGFSIHLAAHR